MHFGVLFTGFLQMRDLKVMLLVVFVVMSVSRAVAGEARVETDACLVTLYNYPAEAPAKYVLKKALPHSSLNRKKNLRAGTKEKNAHSPPKNNLTQIYSEK